MWTLPAIIIIIALTFPFTANSQSHWWEVPDVANTRVVYPFRTDQAGHVISPDVDFHSKGAGPPRRHPRAAEHHDTEEPQRYRRNHHPHHPQSQYQTTSETHDTDDPQRHRGPHNPRLQHQNPFDSPDTQDTREGGSNQVPFDNRDDRENYYTQDSREDEEKLYIVINNADEELFLSLTPNTRLVTPYTIIEWVLEDGRRIYKRPAQGCFYTGHLQAREGSLVAVSNCGGLTGYIQTSNNSYFIQPLKRPDGESGSDAMGPQPHLIYTVQAVTSRLNLSLQQDQEFQMPTDNTQTEHIQTITERIQTFTDLEQARQSITDPLQTFTENTHPGTQQTHPSHPPAYSNQEANQNFQDQIDLLRGMEREFQRSEGERWLSDVTQFRDNRHDTFQRRPEQDPEFKHQIPGRLEEGEEDEEEEVSVVEHDRLFKRRRRRKSLRAMQRYVMGGEENHEEEQGKKEGKPKEKGRIDKRGTKLDENLLVDLGLKSRNWRRNKRSEIHPKFRGWQGPPKFARNSKYSRSTERRGRSAILSGAPPKFNGERRKREEEEEEIQVERKRDIEDTADRRRGEEAVNTGSGMEASESTRNGEVDRLNQQSSIEKSKESNCTRGRNGEEGAEVGNTDGDTEGSNGSDCGEEQPRRRRLSREERARRREERRNRRRQERERRKLERERRKQEKKRKRREERRKRRREGCRVTNETNSSNKTGDVSERTDCTSLSTDERPGEERERRKKKEKRSKRREKRRKRKKKRKGRKNRRNNNVQSEENISSNTPQGERVDPWEGQDWDGYSPDLWTSQVAPGSSGLREVTPMPPLATPDPPKWMELVVAADHTLIRFHGQDQVEKYVFTLFNIVSAIYQDPSLEANLELVMLRIIFYNDTKHSQVREGQAKKSLEAVNRWAERLHRVSPTHLQHDLAVWLTRTNLGGPSGYAPVAGVCQPARSCTLNRDEGLTSAFIIAHEMAHVLGMSHDGDSVAANDCEDEGFQGSVMAPLVAATFNRFHWSHCSRREYHAKARNWECLLNKPEWKNATTVHSTIQYQYSLDDQCRMEFGEGYGLCDSVGGTDPCLHLWCSNASAPFHCKTKKGPPLEGTLCGEQKWCRQGFCVTMNDDDADADDERGPGGRDPPVRHNPRPGGWGTWGSWGPCSRTCGTGVAFRTRVCDSPTPAWGGRSCRGKREEWRVCGHGECSLPRKDPRAIQCSRLSHMVPLDPRRAALTWLPYEPKRRKKKCRLSCYSHATNEVYIGREFVVDGTPCSYDNPTDICVQGKCVVVGCDGVVGSRLREDQCGVCQGDGTTCVTHHYQYQQVPPPEYTLVATLPAGAHSIMVREETPTANFLAVSSNSSSRSSSSTSPAFFLNGLRSQEPSKSFIGEGAKFVYSNREERELLRARGPLLSPLSVMIHGTVTGESVQITTTYLTQMRPEHHQWEVGPYTACSVTCGGGEKHETLVCRDRRTDRQVFHDRCRHLPRPPLNTTTCNTFGCEARWITGRWEHCSASCGPGGVQERGVFCVTLPEAVAANWSAGIVDPRQCAPQPMPEVQRECLRDPCPGHWMPAGWGECSSSCGEGTEERLWECSGGDGGGQHEITNEVTYNCPTPIPKQVRVCVRPTCSPAPCVKDESPFCQLPVLYRYCQLPKYRELCCHTCTNVVY